MRRLIENEEIDRILSREMSFVVGLRPLCHGCSSARGLSPAADSVSWKLPLPGLVAGGLVLALL